MIGYEELKDHIGHDIVIVYYGDMQNVALECMDCMKVIIDFDKEDN